MALIPTQISQGTLQKEYRVFSSDQRANKENRPTIVNWFMSANLGIPRGINVLETRQYAKSAWVQMATNAITKQIMVTDWAIVPVDEEDVNNVEPYKADIEKATQFLESPNQRGNTFWEVWIPYLRDILEIDAGVIYKGRNGRGELVEIYSYDGGRFLADMDEFGDIRGYYQYSMRFPSNAPKFFKKNDIIYGVMNTNNELYPYGWAPLQSIQQEVELLIQSTRFNKDFFANNAIPDGMLTVPMKYEQMQRYKQSWEKEVKGRAHKLLFHNVEGASFTPFNMTNKDMEWLEGQKWYFHLVFGAYGVSPQEVGFYENSNKSTGESQERITIKNAIKPYLVHIDAKINREILPELLGPECKVKFKWFLTDSAQEKVEHDQAIQKLNSNVYTINEVRAKEGLSPVEWGDEPMSMFMQERNAELFDESKQPNSKDNPGDKEQKRDNKEDRDSKKEDRELEKSAPDFIEQEEAADYASFLRKEFRSWQSQVLKAVDSHLKGDLQKDVEKTFGDFLSRIFNVVNTAGFLDQLKKAIKKDVKSGIEEAEAELKIDIGFGPFVERDVEQVAQTQLEGFKLPNGKDWYGLKGVAKQVREEVVMIAATGIAERKKPAQVKDDIKKVMEQHIGTEVSEGRAMKIARTETTRIRGNAKLKAMREVGLDIQKTWVAKEDACEICKSIHGSKVDLNESFVDLNGNKYDHPPPHPNCRCVISAV